MDVAFTITRLLQSLFFISLLVLNACNTVTTRKSTGEEVVMSQEEFSKYVEDVFRHHNQVMAELMAASTDRIDQPAAESKELEQAEKDMVRACEPLNEVVTETLSGETLSLKLKMTLSEAVPTCDKATNRVEDLVP
ncbi:MAG: hypothetical protein D4R76_03610 [Methylococcus sp.]|jgi:hypothetical protein|nr:MAG: hypothetical protein D4R76_03610 [Methylococcus sp.]